MVVLVLAPGLQRRNRNATFKPFCANFNDMCLRCGRRLAPCQRSYLLCIEHLDRDGCLARQ